MSIKDDTFEMLDDTPKNSKKSIILLLILLLIIAGGIPLYLQKNLSDPARPVANMSEPKENEPPGPTPTAAVQISNPIATTVNFDEASAVLKPDQTSKLRAFYQQLKASAGTIQIDGYTDNLGLAQEGLLLSKQRAEGVAAFLNTLGKNDKLKLTVNSFGENNPVGDNSTAEGRQQNRRVELKFTPTP